ncbi:hypothetical protein BZL29_1494 [Mycobacterium kansasii]|uniref:Uncharacterized protein n=1 Tax=Mycobacterium kansasii TaxID=1768 RepID=A0A1V3XW50_MYCKA|nr:hypothetical protein BZL29_1494 [Mycobacterium kansasii]
MSGFDVTRAPDRPCRAPVPLAAISQVARRARPQASPVDASRDWLRRRGAGSPA